MLASQSQSLDNYHNWQTSLYMNVNKLSFSRVFIHNLFVCIVELDRGEFEGNRLQNFSLFIPKKAEQVRVLCL